MTRTEPLDPLHPGCGLHRVGTLMSGLVLGLIIVAPHLARLSWPSLYADDALRIAQLRLEPLHTLVFQPFNEHFTPIFHLISWLTWEISGQQLTKAPYWFTLASFVPFPITLCLFAWVVWRRTASRVATLFSLVVAGVSWLYVDVVANYSGSGFVWALGCSLCAFECAGLGSRLGWMAACACVMCAPAFSGIGLLAGPMGVVGAWMRPGKLGQRCQAALWPVAGLVLYLGLAAGARQQAVLGASLERHLSLEKGLPAAARAMIGVLPQALVNARPWDETLPGWGDLVLAGVVLGCLIAWSWVDRPGRPLILAGLLLIVGGYGLTYPVRSDGSVTWLLRTDRYHLFPHFGLALMAAAAVRRISKWVDVSARRSWVLSICAILIFTSIQWPNMWRRLRFYDFPEQRRVLAAIDRLEELARAAGITRDQVLAALEPISTSWLQPERNGANALVLLGRTVASPRVADPDVRPLLLAQLGARDREALWGGMEATRYAHQPQSRATLEVESAHLVRTSGMRATGENRFQSRGWPAFAEFEFPAGGEASQFRPEVLELPVWIDTLRAQGLLPPLELWWTNQAGEWSETRRITWRPEPGSREPARIPLDRIPHFDPTTARYVRVLVRPVCALTLEAPRLLR